jgi:hypothetical protein
LGPALAEPVAPNENGRKAKSFVGATQSEIQGLIYRRAVLKARLDSDCQSVLFHMIDEKRAISLATQYLQKAGISPFRCDIDVSHVTIDERRAMYENLRLFFVESGQSEDDFRHYVEQSSDLNFDHWCVRFYQLDEPGTVTNTPPRIVLIYDADGRAEFPKY